MCNLVVISTYQFSNTVLSKDDLLILTLFSSSVINNFENNLQTDVIYTDFSKAFDRVNHDLLIQKLIKIGFPNMLIKWIRSYLTKRTQQVIYKNSISNTIYVLSGVPQGSHIGPVLFNLFINDLPNCIVNSSILMYADDCKVYRSIKDSNDNVLLQNDLDNFQKWCKQNQMCLNSKKCFVMTFSRKSNSIRFDYSIESAHLQRNQTFMDLGILFDTKCSFNAHIDYILSKSYSKLGCVLRWSRELKDDEILLTLYLSLVRSNLEYCSPLWCPNYQNNINKLESLQKKFLLNYNRLVFTDFNK